MRKVLFKYILLFACLAGVTKVRSQDSLFARSIVDTLTGPYFWGRGYTNNGMAKAADFIKNQFSSFGLKPLSGSNFFQPFSYPVNIFPGKMQVSINNITLQPGKDFIVAPASKGITASGTLIQQDSIHFMDTVNRIMVTLKDKLTWSVAAKAAGYTSIEIDKKQFTQMPQTVQCNIENKELGSFKAANVCGIVKGTVYPDSVIFITGHYDHLGGMGTDTYFPGANDNASGISLLLALAKYYAQHPQAYSIGFICFAGEEAGLIGSKYFTEHPLLPLQNIRFLLNLDLEGTGIEGVTVVNASVYPTAFSLLQSINNRHHYLAAVNARGKAANSDHYWFTEKGVPAFFMYTLGGIKAYHDVFDRPATLPLNEINNLSSFIKEFVTQLMNKN